MVNYFALLPAASVRTRADGSLFAWVDYRVNASGPFKCDAYPIDIGVPIIAHGVASVPIGTAPNAARVQFLPFGVTGVSA